LFLQWAAYSDCSNVSKVLEIKENTFSWLFDSILSCVSVQDQTPKKLTNLIVKYCLSDDSLSNNHSTKKISTENLKQFVLDNLRK